MCIRDSWEVIEGRMLTQEEVDGASKVALIGQTVSRNLFGDEDPLGQVIRIKKVPFTIIGVMDRKGQTTWGQDQDDQILIPISTAKTKVPVSYTHLTLPTSDLV